MATHPLGGKGRIGNTPEDHKARTAHKGWQSDNAVDLAVAKDTPVYAVEDGVIGSRIGPFNSSAPTLAGNRLTLKATSGNAYYYAHLSALAEGIEADAEVHEGDLLGWSGTAVGVPHLHFAMRHGDPVALIHELQPFVGFEKIEFTDNDVRLHPQDHVIIGSSDDFDDDLDYDDDDLDEDDDFDDDDDDDDDYDDGDDGDYDYDDGGGVQWTAPFGGIIGARIL